MSNFFSPTFLFCGRGTTRMEKSRNFPIRRRCGSLLSKLALCRSIQITTLNFKPHSNPHPSPSLPLPPPPPHTNTPSKQQCIYAEPISTLSEFQLPTFMARHDLLAQGIVSPKQHLVMSLPDDVSRSPSRVLTMLRLLHQLIIHQLPAPTEH